MKVILHADDFGFDKDTLEATIECFEKGALTSASVMVNCEASEQAFEYANNHPEFSFGVHLTYVDGYKDGLKPVSSSNELNSLVHEDGSFLESDDVRKKAMFLQLKKIQIIKESQAQIDKMQNSGVKVSHLDSHGHLHKFLSILYSLKYLKISGQKKLRVRGVQNVFIDKPSWKSPNTILNKYFKWYLKRYFRNPEYFYMSANNLDTNWADTILAAMEKLPNDAIIEIGVHPGHLEEWKQHEFDDIMDFTDKLRKSNKHEIVTWNQV